MLKSQLSTVTLVLIVCSLVLIPDLDGGSLEEGWNEISLPIRSQLKVVPVEPVDGVQLYLTQVGTEGLAKGNEVPLYEVDHDLMEAEIASKLTADVLGEASISASVLKMAHKLPCPSSLVSSGPCELTIYLTASFWPEDDVHRLSLDSELPSDVFVTGFAHLDQSEHERVFVLLGKSEDGVIRMESRLIRPEAFVGLRGKLREHKDAIGEKVRDSRRENSETQDRLREEIKNYYGEVFASYNPFFRREDHKRELQAPIVIDIPTNDMTGLPSRVSVVLNSADAIDFRVSEASFHLYESQDEELRGQNHLSSSSWVLATEARDPLVATSYLHYKADRGYREFGCSSEQARQMAAVGVFSRESRSYVLANVMEDEAHGDTIHYFEWAVESPETAFFDYILWFPPLIGERRYVDLRPVEL